MSGLKSYRKYAVNFRLRISSLVSPLASLFLELNIMESKFSVFTSACHQLIASKENVNIEGECSSIDDIKCWISEFEQFKSLTFSLDAISWRRALVKTVNFDFIIYFALKTHLPMARLSWRC